MERAACYLNPVSFEDKIRPGNIAGNDINRNIDPGVAEKSVIEGVYIKFNKIIVKRQGI
jgi:hypothetical protein